MLTRLYRVTSAALCAALLGASPHRTALCQSAAAENWAGMYMSGHKIGYTSTITSPATWNNKACTKLVTHSHTQLSLLGNAVEQTEDSTLYTTSSEQPIHQELSVTSAGSSIHLVAEYEPTVIHCTLNTGGGASKRDVVVPKGAKLLGDSDRLAPAQGVAVGVPQTYYYLNPLTVALDKMTVVDHGEQQVTVNGKQLSAHQYTASTPYGDVTDWETAGGETAKADLPLGMTLYSLPKDQALAAATPEPVFALAGKTAEAHDYKPPSDFALATSIKAAGNITDPRNLMHLTVRVDGLTDSDRVLPDARQTITAVAGEEGSYIYHINAAVAPTPNAGDAAARDYAGPDAYLETSDPSVRQVAATLRANSKSAVDTAIAIHDWVHAHMKPDYSLAVPRSCVAILNDRRGVCRDYATLFAGIARAAGIPTRLAAGIVYAEGRFYYHAWDECYLNGWVTFDSTLPGRVVDATHIKFAQGSVTNMYAVATIVGRLRLTIQNASR